MTNAKPLILISNDDGYQAKGINQLVEMLSDMAEILVYALSSKRRNLGLRCGRATVRLPIV